MTTLAVSVRFHVMASFAQLERKLVTTGKAGRVGGRKRRMTESKVAAARKLLEDGAPPRDVAHDLSLKVYPR